jgi:predicted permease
LKYWLNGARREADLRAEMEAHLEELRAEGLDDATARRRFGNFGARQEEAREIWIARYWSDFWQDVRHGARGLRREPGFTAVAVLSAALGIGACATVFSLVNFALFRPLPVAENDRLMALTGLKKGQPGGAMSYPEIRDIGTSARAWEGVAAFDPMLAAGIGGRRHWGFLVTSNYFDVVRPAFALGRGFIAGEDDRAGAPARVVLGHALWRTAFRSDPDILGHTVLVNKQPMTVVGVTAPGFQGTEVGVLAEFFLPLSQLGERSNVKGRDSRQILGDYNSQWLTAVGRLRPGFTLPQAQAELDSVAREIAARVPDRPPARRFFAERAGQLTPFLRRLAVPAFVLLLGVTFLVLLTACANVANLMLGRATARAGEIATRMAIGAGRGRLIRQLLTESLLLGLAGGALGIALAEWAGRYIGGFRLPLPIPFDWTPTVDHRVVAFSAALAIVTALAFGLAPALRATRMTGIDSASRRSLGLRDALVVAQVAISTVLVLASALALRSLSATRGVDSGMNARNLALVEFDPALSRYDEAQTVRLIGDVLRDAESVSSVRSATVVNMLPLSLAASVNRVTADGGATEQASILAVGPRYFETMGTPLLAGREFPSTPGGEPTVIINQELARRLFPGQVALGRWLSNAGRRARVVGVVANSKYRMLQEAATPILYAPILGEYATQGSFGGLTLLVRSAQPPEVFAARLRRLDPELVVNSVRTMEAHLEAALFLPRLAAALFGLCGAMGLAIALVGIYGVVSFAVERRRREISIRMALGARAGQVVALVLRRGAGLSAIGTAAGVFAGLGLARVARSLVYGVSSIDPLTFLSVPPLLLTVALLAAAVPARRAARVDPNRMLRSDSR